MRENVCQQNSQRVTRTMIGASSSWRPVATEDPSSEEKVHLHPNTDGHQEVRRSCKHKQDADRGGARILL